ncbi:MAG: hypothetical protein IJX81_07480 [Clostridia bacterium]|nr:hypothetical protein [Clostridia bacterium]
MELRRKEKLTVSIVDFGAKSSVEELQTASIQAAIDHCFQAGGGEVQIPEGEFYSGGIRLRSNVTLHLLKNAKLIGSRNCEDYFVLRDDKLEPVPAYILTPENRINGRSLDGQHFGLRWYNSFIKAYHAKNIAIIGDEGSVIDGRDCYDAQGEEEFRGPHCIGINECENIKYYGYTIVNSANWAHMSWRCKNVFCENVTVIAGHDAFDVFASNHVRVKNCTFHSGDDCIAGYDNQDVAVENCDLSSSCSAFRFSGTHVRIKNCKVEGNSKYVHRYTLTKEEQITSVLLSDEENPNHRYRMKSFYTYYGDNRLVIRKLPSDIVIENCEIANPEKLFHFNYSGSEQWSSNRPLGQIKLKNIKAKNLVLPMVAYGDKETPLDITFENVTVGLEDGYRDDCVFRTANLKKMVLKNFSVENFKGKVLFRNYGMNNGRLVLKNVDGLCGVSIIEETTEPFTVDMI